MQADGDPKLFFARAYGTFLAFSALGVHMFDPEVAGLLIRRFPSEFSDVKQSGSLLRSGITRSEMGQRFCISDANHKAKALEEWKLACFCWAVGGFPRPRR